MRVGVGYSENPDTSAAGRQAAESALLELGQMPCTLVLMFATARHNAKLLRKTVAAVVGSNVPIVGGGSVGGISNNQFGYDGDQIILATFALQDVTCDIIVQEKIADNEREAGRSLGKKMEAYGIRPESSVMLFYDAINRIKGDVHLTMASPLLDGIEQSMGFLPKLIGAGMQGDFLLSSTPQWTGAGLGEHTALALSFSGDIQIDSLIIHGCKPGTGYYTVTKADGQTILEINNQPALKFVENLLKSSIRPDDFPFFLIFGVNKGGKWDDFNEEIYASRLCLAIDKERSGIVMFEPDMVVGTEFQIMYRSLHLDYMPPRIEELFARLNGRKPVFALYINCAGRAAGYVGKDLEDAVVVQETVAGRVPLMGIYTGVEIGLVQGKPRVLDWTGVFCLFSVAA